MDNLNSVLESKTLEDLQSAPVLSGSNLIEPSVDTINQVLDCLKAGHSYLQAKRECVQLGPNGQKWTLSKGQIQQIDLARKAKIQELTPKEE
jgi:hypothetical protein